MLKLIVTDAVISKGYNGAPAIRFYEGDETQIANFKIGKRVFDSKAEDKHRWINFNVKVFGNAGCERIKKMKLKEGSYISMVARYDEESWEDKNSGELRSAPVLILDEIEFSGGGSGQKGTSQTDSGNASDGRTNAQNSASASAPAAAVGVSEMPDNFTGFDSFGSGNGFF